MLSRNTYHLPQVPSSHHPRAVVDLDGVEVLLHHHQQPQHYHFHQQQVDVFPSFFLSPAVENATLFNQDNGDPSFSAALHRKPTAKKDRHSKINTAQGPRDRRVRLSISIARKFFDLQEMLGFDKPSKTLDWLLTKSKAAIKELVQTKKHASASDSCKTSSSSLLSSENGDDSKRKSGGKDKQAAAAPSLAKESRAKARARARERTLEKMCIKQFGGAGDNGPDPNPSFQCRNNQLEFLQLYAGSSRNNLKMSAGYCELVNPPHCPLDNEAATLDLIEESIAIKRKHKNPSVFGFQQNLLFSRDLNSKYMVPSANASENWDVFGSASQSNLHAILDQHKFFNRNSNI